MTMTSKSKPPATAKTLRKTGPRQDPKALANPLRAADSRWQRTVRYGWDKGGAQGGRKS